MPIVAAFALGGMVGGAVTGALEGGWKGALMGAAAGALIGAGVGEWGLPVAIAATALGAANAYITGGKKGLSDFSANLAGGLIGAALGEGIGQGINGGLANIKQTLGGVQESTSDVAVKTTISLEVDNEPVVDPSDSAPVYTVDSSSNSGAGYTANEGVEGQPTWNHISDPEGTLVIGKLADLAKPGALEEGDFTLSWPDQGSPKLNWQTNASLLRSAIREGLPIKDISYGKGGGFLAAERNLLSNKGLKFDETDNHWK